MIYLNFLNYFIFRLLLLLFIILNNFCLFNYVLIAYCWLAAPVTIIKIIIMNYLTKYFYIILIIILVIFDSLLIHIVIVMWNTVYVKYTGRNFKLKIFWLSHLNFFWKLILLFVLSAICKFILLFLTIFKWINIAWIIYIFS